MPELRCRRCGGRVSWTPGMVACLPDGAGLKPRCTPACRNCGRELVQDESPHLQRDRERSFWQRACGCVLEVSPPAYTFSDEEVARFVTLLRDRGAPADVADTLGRHMLEGLAEHMTRSVLGLPDGDMVITADEARETIGRDLRGQPAI